VKTLPRSLQFWPADTNLCFVQACAAAFGTLARLQQPVFAEHKTALFAARRLDHDMVAGGARRSNGVTQIVFDVLPIETQLARERRDRSWLNAEQLDEIAAEGHGDT
jgi:hypothetical protein